MDEKNPSLKRQREDEKTPQQQQQQQQDETYKRQRSYKDIITLLEEDEDEPTHDLSSLISTLQQEISEPGSGSGSDPVEPAEPGSSPGSGVEEVMRHLLEASDDELGIPSTKSGESSCTEMDGGDLLDGGHVDGGDLFLPVFGGDGLWEFEDHEAANYYDLLQSELFIKVVSEF